MDREKIKKLALDIKRQHPTWGGKLVAHELRKRGIDISFYTINSWFYRPTVPKNRKLDPKPPMRIEFTQNLHQDIRAAAIMDLLEGPPRTAADIIDALPYPSAHVRKLMDQLEDDGYIVGHPTHMNGCLIWKYTLARTTRFGRPLGHELRV